MEGCKRRGENDAAVAAKSCRRIANVCAQASRSKENICRKGKEGRIKEKRFENRGCTAHRLRERKRADIFCLSRTRTAFSVFSLRLSPTSGGRGEKRNRTRGSFCFVSLCDARGDVGRRFLEGGVVVVLVSLDVRRHRHRRRHNRRVSLLI